MKRIRYTGLFLLLLVSWSCSEVYLPDDIDSAQRIPVIQGLILQGQAPRVTISWARNYSDEAMQFISGATVTVNDNTGNSTVLSEVYTGVYSPLYYNMVGEVGNSYTLTVILPDGSTYVSSSQYLPPQPNIDSLYAIPGLNEEYTYNSSGKPISSTYKGLRISSDLSDYGFSDVYYRFSTKYVKMMVYTEDIGTPASHSVYLWETRILDNSYSVDYSVFSGSRQVLLQHPVGFLRYFYDVSLQTETKTAPYTEGWVLTFNVYSISRDVYDYYNSIGRQLDADDQIFAPVASQVKSNIRCLNDPAKKVAGVFEASSKKTVYRAFRWNSMTEHYSKDLDSFPEDVGDGSSLYWPPYFWVYF